MKKTKKFANKSEFVRAHPKLTAAEIVKTAKAAGIKISPNYVYVIRSKAGGKKRGPKATPAVRAYALPKKAPAEIDKSLFEARSAEYLRIVRDIGLVHATELLEIAGADA